MDPILQTLIQNSPSIAALVIVVLAQLKFMTKTMSEIGSNVAENTKATTALADRIEQSIAQDRELARAVASCQIKLVQQTK